MSPRERIVLTEALWEHPAVRAWTAATSLGTAPKCIHVLRERHRVAVYWLPGVGRGGAGVYAKRTPSPTATVERTLYEEILPHLPIAGPRYYGNCFDGPYGWIFVEDVGGERYSQADPDHLELAARWVGTLHVGGAQMLAARSLPDAGPARYLEHLRLGRQKILRGLRTWPFPPGELAVLGAVLSHCDTIEARWVRLEETCQGAPQTLVHGDFQPKNVFLRNDGAGPCLCVFDWETAGYGVPAADLTRIDLRTYWSLVRSAWPTVGFDTVKRLAAGGHVLQALAEVHWLSEWFKHDSVAGRSDAVLRLEPVVRNLDHAAHSAGLVG